MNPTVGVGRVTTISVPSVREATLPGGRGHPGPGSLGERFPLRQKSAHVSRIVGSPARHRWGGREGVMALNTPANPSPHKALRGPCHAEWGSGFGASPGGAERWHTCPASSWCPRKDPRRKGGEPQSSFRFMKYGISVTLDQVANRY